MESKTQKLVTASLFAALACVTTIIIKIPSPLKGYLNLGDCIVLITGWTLSPSYAFLSSGLGSALADIFSGYVIYAPATFIIKGAMALIARKGFYLLQKKSSVLSGRIISGFIAELVMILGYFIFEGILYGFFTASINIPANAIQGVVCLILGILLIHILKNKSPLS